MHDEAVLERFSAGFTSVAGCAVDDRGFAFQFFDDLSFLYIFFPGYADKYIMECNPPERRSKRTRDKGQAPATSGTNANGQTPPLFPFSNIW